MASQQAPALRPSTWAAYRSNVELPIVPAIGRAPLRRLRPDHIERLYADLLADETLRAAAASTASLPPTSTSPTFASSNRPG